MGGLVALWLTSGLLSMALAVVVTLLARCGVLSLGHGLGMFAGAYTAASLWLDPGQDIVARSTGEIMLGLLAAGVAGGASGLLVGVAAVRVRGDALLVISLLFVEVARRLTVEASVFGGSTGKDVTLNMDAAWRTAVAPCLAAVLLATTAGAACWIDRRGIGAACDAVRHDAVGAEMLGIPVASLRLVLCVLVGAASGVGGVVRALSVGRITPDLFDLPGLILIFATALMGSTRGWWMAACMGLLLVAVPECFRVFPFEFSIRSLGTFGATDIWPFVVASIIALGGVLASTPASPR